MTNKTKILAVPTNIITGFLGVGKTSAIMHLITQKPEHERWAVLVNEFGEIGVDGSLFNTSSAQNHNVYIEEVPGGCMCCTSGVPMQIALNKLLAKARPHRLLIEPTGLGHPLEVLQLLTSQYYRDVLTIQNTVTLVDARNLANSRYTQHPTFNQQINIADVVVGNKADLYHVQDKSQLATYLTKSQKNIKNDVTPPPLYFSEQGNISLSWLTAMAKHKGFDEHQAHDHHPQKTASRLTHQNSQEIAANSRSFPTSGIIRVDNAGEGYHSVGWRFSPDKTFNKQALLRFLNSLNVIRVKAIFMTNKGAYSYNKAGDTFTENPVNKNEKNTESRIEIIYDANKAKTDPANVIHEQWHDILLDTIEQPPL